MAEIRFQKPVKSNSSVPLKDIIYRTLHYWPFILLSIVVCVGISFIYLLRTPNTYQQSASLLIKDNGKGKSTGGVEDFGEYGLFSNKTNIKNEIMSLKSPDLMEEVVVRLHLDMNYYTPGKFHDMVAYGSSLPVEVDMIDYPDNSAASFSLKLSSDGKVEISGMKLSDGVEDKKTYSGTLGQPLATPAGKIMVSPSSYYAKGETIILKVIKTPLDDAVASYEERLNVSTSTDNSSIIDLSFTDQNIQRADEVLGTVIAVYNELWIRDKNQIAVSTSNFINERLKVIEDELGNVDSDISSYKSENLVPDVGAAASGYMSQNEALEQQLLDMGTQLQMTRYIRDYIVSETNSDKLLPSNTGVNNLSIESQISSYNNLLLERNNLREKSSSKNPLVKNMDKDLAEMRTAMIGSVDNAIVNLETQLKGLQKARGVTTSKLASNPSQAKYLLSVERQQKVKESLYLFLLQKREDNELNQAFTAYNSRVIKKPGGSTAPIAPNRRNILMIAFVIGLAIPFAVVFVKESSNTTVRGRKDLESMLPPLLGEIPQNVTAHNKKGKDADRSEILVKAKSRNIINEAFRVLRTNVEFAKINKTGCNVIALTSFNPASGKSFISINLATAISLKNKKVLVIDGDMRHGSASQYVGKHDKGLSSYLCGETDDVESLLISIEDAPNLKVLPIGKVPPNPAELLESPLLEQLIEDMREKFDYIIIDCPPIEVVADAQIIDQYADRTVFVIRAGLLERSMLTELDRLYDEKKYKHMAIILNGTRNDRGRYGYSHSYKYGYGYGYGYGYSYDSKE